MKKMTKTVVPTSEPVTIAVHTTREELRLAKLADGRVWIRLWRGNEPLDKGYILRKADLQRALEALLEGQDGTIRI